MLPALQMALGSSNEQERLRQVVFITDGAVSNETELFTEIRNNLGNNRLFTVGIGSAPNSYFMRKAALAGRGTFTYVSNPKEVNQKISHLLRQLESPALTGLDFDLLGQPAEVLPKILPDLYLGEPVYVAFKANNFPDFAQLSGRLGGVSSILDVSLSNPQRHEGIAIEWARRKISAMLSRFRDKNHNQSGEDKARIRNEIVDLAIAHHQVSQFTSLVAVDVTPSDSVERAGGLLVSKRIAANRPKGWVGSAKPKKAGIRLAQTATDSRYRLLVGISFMLTAILTWFLFWRFQGRALWLRS